MDTIKRVKLSEIAILITKGTTPTTLGYSFQDDGVNFLKIECFAENGEFIKEKVSYISDECHEKLKRSQLKNGDILFSIAGAIGRVAVVTEEMLPANTNQALAIVRINSEDIYLPYIKLILTSPIIKAQFERKKQGVAQLNISLKDINDLEIPLPEKSMQIEYATLFENVSNIITARQQELQKLDELVKARFVEMCGDMVLNPNHWERVPLGKVCDVRDGTHDSPQYCAEGYPLVTSKNVTGGHIDMSGCNLICKEDYDKINERSKVDYGDILMPMIGTVGKPVVVDIVADFAIKNVALIKFHNDSLVNNIFVKTLLESDYFDRTVISKIRGGTQKFISLGDIRGLEICLPPMASQNEFSKFVKQIDKSKFVVQQALDKAQTLFDSLMQKYFINKL
ncbi:MAG: restriction endonuclease subunit S [Oscillospiraceae bacterium]|nr:restriction endonuclease subunit S [Candidatus Ruminococcus equi]